MIFPYLSSYQTLENSLGSLDPIGMYSIADRLAMRLAPDLRERMKHPRYLTAMAVGSIICSDFSEEELATDELSAPWQVYEWYVVSALVKHFEKETPEQLIGLPGREKATKALHENIPLSAVRYLKSPSVFGFHGVYRTLAKGIQLMDDNQCGEFGIRLIDVWEAEQGLNGFRLGLKGSEGNNFRIKMRDAVHRGLKKGAVDRSWYWDFYPLLAGKLMPKSPGKKEAALLFNRLLESDTPSRSEVIKFITSTDGRDAFKEGSEKDFHTALLNSASDSTKELLLAIQAYEHVARLLYNAFYEMLHWMSSNQNKANIMQLASLSYVYKAYNDIKGAIVKVERFLEPFIEESQLFNLNFRLFQGVSNPAELVVALIEHHTKVQKHKPPNGKAAWIFELGADKYLLNSTQSNWPKLNDEYVHQYRTNSLKSFMNDLGKTKK